MEAAPSRRAWTSLVSSGNPYIAAALVAGFVLWAHLGSHLPVFRSYVSLEPGWKDFRTAYSVNDFGEDGHWHEYPVPTLTFQWQGSTYTYNALHACVRTAGYFPARIRIE